MRVPIVDNQALNFEMPSDLDQLARDSNRAGLARHLFDAIGKVTTHRADFDVLLIYLPDAWEAC